VCACACVCASFRKYPVLVFSLFPYLGRYYMWKDNIISVCNLCPPFLDFYKKSQSTKAPRETECSFSSFFAQ
jgi:hypothetical protein